MVFLQSHGVGITRAVRIYKTYGDQALEIVRDNPYKLALDIRGIGFKTADDLAQQLGIDKQAMIRAQAGVCHVLQTLCDNGHCAARQAELIDSSIKLLDIPESIIKQAIEHEVAQAHLVPEMINDVLCLYPAALYYAEVQSAKHLLRLSQYPLPWGKINIDEAIPWAETKANLQLSNSQSEAIRVVLQNKITIITGGPGVGKTTIVNSFLKILLAKHCEIALCAPTGRARELVAWRKISVNLTVAITPERNISASTAPEPTDGS